VNMMFKMPFLLTAIILSTSLKVVLTNPAKALMELRKFTGSRYQSGPMEIGQSRECADRAQVRLCRKHKRHCKYTRIQYYCERTCGVCSPPDTTGCSDVHPQCTVYANQGFCTGKSAQVAFMTNFCKKTCGWCKGTDPSPETRACGIATLRKGRTHTLDIVGGAQSRKGDFPWQVAIYHNNRFLCGGSLIDVTHVLSAAHCFNGIADDVRKYLVVLGEYNRDSKEGTEQEVKVAKITVHENYERVSNQDDIAIVQLAERARISDHIETICLPEQGEVRQAGSKCMLSGWGKEWAGGEAVSVLQQLQVPIVNQHVCNDRNKYTGRRVTSNMMCSGYNNGYSFASGCHGDSGGPLSCQTSGNIWKVFGIVSWGSSQCNGLESYTVYTKVSSYLPWIKRQTS